MLINHIIKKISMTKNQTKTFSPFLSRNDKGTQVKDLGQCSVTKNSTKPINKANQSPKNHSKDEQPLVMHKNK